MFKNLIQYILANIFKIKSQTTEEELSDNSKYAEAYKKIDDINFDAIFARKIANYAVADSNLNIEEDNQRAKVLNDVRKVLWSKRKKITSMALGTGGIVLVPYVENGALNFTIVNQDRISIDATAGERIIGATVLADTKTITSAFVTNVYNRWANYQVKNNTLVIHQRYTNQFGALIEKPDFWANIKDETIISNVDRVIFAYVKSPIDNRKTADLYGVPITYGCESKIAEIKETLKQIAREYEVKKAFVGADVTMFGKDDELPSDGIFRKIDSGTDDFWEIFDPAIRDSSYYNRLEEEFSFLEKQIGTSRGILTKLETKNATATEIKSALKDTFTIVDDVRVNLEKAFEDFFYACNVLASAYKLSADGEYSLKYDWNYSLLEDPQQEFSNLLVGVDKGVITKSELRQWLKPDETIEESQKAVEEIKASEPSVKDLLGSDE